MDKLSYLAGFLDGEGCIGISRSRHKGRISYGAYIKVTNTDMRSLLWLEKNFGGGICRNSSKTTYPHKKPLFQWSLYGKRACELSKKLIWILIIKKKQAELLCRFGPTIWKKHLHGTAKILGDRRLLYIESRNLNAYASSGWNLDRGPKR